MIDCHRALDPESFNQVYNDYFVKLYLTALIKRQWGQNLIKFRGVKLLRWIRIKWKRNI